MEIETIRKQFIESFDFEENGFINPVILTDSKIGFSVQRKCEKRIQDLLKMDEDKIYTTLIRIYISERALNEEGNKKTLTIRASFHLYRDEKFYIDDSHIHKKYSKPIDLESQGEYYYDISSNEFFKKSTPYTANQVLNEIYGLHIKPSRFWRGLFLRAKMRFKSSKAFTVKLISDFFAFLLYTISGTRVSENIFARYYDDDKIGVMGTAAVTDTREPSKTTVFGLTAPRRPIIVYSVIHLFVFTLFFLINYRPALIRLIFSNNFLTAIYVIVTFACFEGLLPAILSRLVKSTTDMHMKILFKEIKI